MTQTLKVAQTPKSSKAPKAPAAPKAPKAPRLSKRSRLARRLVAGWAGGAGLAVLGLSVSHVATAIQAITGEGAGSVALAIGVDCGMVACEAIEAICGDCEEAVAWAKRVVWGTLGLSAALNAWAFSAHAATWALWVLSIGLGVLCPFLVFGLFRAATAAWRSGEAR
jgi:hypothetical protein